ncbi:hypothetical protein ATANTOWER_017123 [Ataeniobius toweri]|uniref:Uncharacterized protein n=1 Tax=Ataeniobius toweri TaxID=208326 RepID=A0ABU7ARJ9_9TELE|nr:hypothetical protein [Ataeniobius toweri]
MKNYTKELGWERTTNLNGNKLLDAHLHKIVLIQKLWPFGTALAALYFNENAHQAQSITQDGESVYGIHYPKYKKGGHIVRKVLEETTYGHCSVSV